jgi:hypothetical protein
MKGTRHRRIRKFQEADAMLNVGKTVSARQFLEEDARAFFTSRERNWVCKKLHGKKRPKNRFFSA